MSKRTREEEGLALALASPECFPSSAALNFFRWCLREPPRFRRADAKPKEHRACRDWLKRASNSNAVECIAAERVGGSGRGRVAGSMAKWSDVMGHECPTLTA